MIINYLKKPSLKKLNNGSKVDTIPPLCSLFFRALRTVGRLKAPLLLLQTAAFIGATLCGINDLHGYAVHLFNVCEIFRIIFHFRSSKTATSRHIYVNLF